MIEKMKNVPDNQEFYAAILTDLSKVFDCVCHDLLIGKLSAYRFDRNGGYLKVIYDYLSDRSQETESRFFGHMKQLRLCSVT